MEKTRDKNGGGRRQRGIRQRDYRLSKAAVQSVKIGPASEEIIFSS